jgi:hypothetical protein
MNIFIDLDGTIVDFVNPFLDLLELDAKTVRKAWPLGEYNLEKIISGPQVGRRFDLYKDTNNPNFWANLPRYEGVKDLFNLCGDFGDVWFVTHTISGAAFVGKREWMKKYLHENYLICTNNRGWLSPKDVLIDDYEKNCTKPNHILVPRIWNRFYELAESLEDEERPFYYHWEPLLPTIESKLKELKRGK